MGARNSQTNHQTIEAIRHCRHPRQRNTVERHDLIALRAYLHADARGFPGGEPMQDWLQAEAEIDREVRLSA